MAINEQIIHGIRKHFKQRLGQPRKIFFTRKCSHAKRNIIFVNTSHTELNTCIQNKKQNNK